jgi:chemotaxis signal transduction protein
MAKGLKSKGETDMLRLGVIPLEAAAPAGAQAAPDQTSMLVFEVGGESFAVGVEHTEGVVDCPRLTPLPSAPDGMLGVVSVRGRITLVMDLGGAGHRPGRRRLILIRGEAQLGLLADKVMAVVALAPKKFKKLAAAEARYAQVAETYFMHDGRRVPVIDVGRLAES